ncbi:MAG: beta-lactamase family protein [Clostridia bacterium]|nr:beta-lactamase family protein [Clostridia bacterium]
MDTERIDAAFQKWIDEKKLPNAVLIVRKDDTVVYRNSFGYSDIKLKTPLRETDLFRMMSMTKPVTAAGVLRLSDRGLLDIDDPVSEYLPAFREMRVQSEERYVPRAGIKPAEAAKLFLTYRRDKVKTVPAEREFTLRDLLSHSAGIEQGVIGFIELMKDKTQYASLGEHMDAYAKYILDFQPGTFTGYSPIAGFDILLRVCEVVSGKTADVFLRDEVFGPLGMRSATFDRTEAQKQGLVRLYKKRKHGLSDVTGKRTDMKNILHFRDGYICGSGGLFMCVDDYERFARMLCNEGRHEQTRFLHPETVRLMGTEAAAKHLEPEPGYTWGLGVKIRQNKDKGGFACTEGTYGWSGAYGTHFFVSPADRIEAVFATNVSNIGGSGSFVNPVLEELVFDIFAKEER